MAPSSVLNWTGAGSVAERAPMPILLVYELVKYDNFVGFQTE